MNTRLEIDISSLVDDHGFLCDMTSWNEQIATELAATEGIELTAEHWEIIYLLRDFYAEFTLAPAMRVLVKQIKHNLGSEKANSIYLLKLFPESPAKIGCKIAGLPKPTNCL